MPKPWATEFPNLGGRFEETSPVTGTYNCMAYAAGDDTTWWEPLPPNLYYWPRGVLRDYTVAAYVAAFESRGYEKCHDGFFDPLWEKVVVFGNRYGGFEHAARQLPDGRWTSKIGVLEDIAHYAPDYLAGGDYGQPVQYMQRSIKPKAAP